MNHSQIYPTPCITCNTCDAYSPQTKCCNATICYNCVSGYNCPNESCPTFGQIALWKAPEDSFVVLMKRAKETGDGTAFRQYQIMVHVAKIYNHPVNPY